MKEINNLINGVRVPVSHGELVLIPVDNFTAKEFKKSKSEIIAHSETGHHHILECDTEFLVGTEVTSDDTNRERQILINDVAKLWHKKSVKRHDDRVIAPGAYIVKEKTEVNPSSGIRQRVFD